MVQRHVRCISHESHEGAQDGKGSRLQRHVGREGTKARKARRHVRYEGTEDT